MKYSALIPICILILISISVTVTAQCHETIKGIYKTGENFSIDSLSYSNSCNTKASRIRLNDFFSKRYITIKQDGSILRLSKYKIFGYKTCCNNVYRFLEKKELLLLNKGEQILVYKHITPNQPSGRTNVTNYFFSVGASSSIQRLTINNIKAAFPGIIKFHQLIDDYFKYNTDLAKADGENKSFLINKLLRKSI